jgi:branched-chain amino acid transport system ATP-binding protein
MATALLSVNGIEVIYNHVILVLKGVSFTVEEGKIVSLLGANGAGKTTTLRAVSNLLKGERGEVTKGSISYKGEAIEKLTRDSGDGRSPLFWAPHCRRKPAHRCLYA